MALRKDFFRSRLRSLTLLRLLVSLQQWHKFALVSLLVQADIYT